MKVLIMEDERALTHALEVKLAREGIEVVSAMNGEVGIELLKHNTFALLLLDLMMPNTNGFMVLEYIRDHHIELPVVVLTNLGMEEDELRARGLGADEYFIKSDTPLADIVSVVHKRLAQSRAGR